MLVQVNKTNFSQSFSKSHIKVIIYKLEMIQILKNRSLIDSQTLRTLNTS